MEPETAVAAVAAGLAAIIAVAVPWVTFRLALRQDQVRWLRERRADLYVDLLTEAHAEREWFGLEIADDETREFAQRHFVDLRLPPFERARLGSRGNIFASRTVNRLFNQVQDVALSHTRPAPKNHGERAMARVRVGEAFDELQDAIRYEMGVDLIRLDPAPRSPSSRPVE
jgi:hypothetical protein